MTTSVVSVQDIMTKDVITVSPDTALTEAAKILADHKFDGVPVVDASQRLIGILTEYDLISKSSAIHLPTFQKIISELHVYRKDRGGLSQEFEELRSLTVRDVMNPEPLTLPDTASFEEVVTAFREHHRVNPIPVIDKNRRVIGVVSRFDVLKPLQLAA